MPRTSIRHLLAALVGLGLAGPASANELGDCGETYAVNSPILCGTALEFGSQAAAIRDALIGADGPTGLNRSAKTGDAGWVGLGVLGGQVTTGSFEGGGAHLILGADRAAGAATRVGGLFFYGQSDTSAPFAPRVDRTEKLIGPQFSTRLGSGDLVTGYLLYGQTGFTVGGTDTPGDTVMGSLIWSRSIDRPGIDLGPFVALSAKREDPDGPDRIDARILTIGTSLDGEVQPMGTGFRQMFGRLELDYGTYEDSFGSSVSYLAPRIGVGARFAFGNGGALQVQGNASQATDDTTIVAAQIGYQLRF